MELLVAKIPLPIRIFVAGMGISVPISVASNPVIGICTGASVTITLYTLIIIFRTAVARIETALEKNTQRIIAALERDRGAPKP